MKIFKPEIIVFKEENFQAALNLFNQKNDIEKRVQTYCKHIATDFNINLNEKFEDQLYLFLEKLDANILNLSGQKIAELKNININNLRQLQKEYLSVKHATLPNEKNFCIYTKNETENERLQAYKDLMKAFYNFANLDKYYNIHDFKRCFANSIDWVYQKPKPKVNFIQNNV
jgi:hypothetical protein